MFSAGAMGIMHGTNDAQKTMGIIALALLSATKAGTFDHLPAWLAFLRTPAPLPGKDLEIATWIKVVCALDHGGRHRRRRLAHYQDARPQNGQTASDQRLCRRGQFRDRHRAGIPAGHSRLHHAQHLGRHHGRGSARRFSAIKWTVVERMVWAWVFTIPVSATISYCLVRLIEALNWRPDAAAAPARLPLSDPAPLR